jgi:hypothetical protein
VLIVAPAYDARGCDAPFSQHTPKEPEPITEADRVVCATRTLVTRQQSLGSVGGRPFHFQDPDGSELAVWSEK